MKGMSHYEKFVIKSNKKADELAKAVAMLDEGFMAEASAETVQQEREEVYAALQLKPNPKEMWIFVDKQSEETKHRTEWCAETDTYRCMS